MSDPPFGHTRGVATTPRRSHRSSVPLASALFGLGIAGMVSFGVFLSGLPTVAICMFAAGAVMAIVVTAILASSDPERPDRG